MLLQFCDKCGRPLSEGCIARGEAIERDGETVCSHCVSAEQSDAAVKQARETGQETTGPLGHYEKAVWHCNSCGIPVTALDLIEGRALRIDDVLKCKRCAPVGEEAPPPRPSAPKPPASRPPARAAKPAVAPRRVSSRAAESFVTAAKSEQRRPVLPIVLFVIVFAGFAASMYFAISSQRKLDEVMAGQNQPADETVTDRRNTRPHERLDPDRFNTSYNDPPDDPEPDPQPETRPQPQPEPPGPEQPAGTPVVPLPSDVAERLIGIERSLAEPVVEDLRSGDRGRVMEGLILAGSRRLIAARPHVRALLRSQDDMVRAIACRVAAMLDDKESLPTLARMADHDPAASVQTEAAKARDRMTGKATREIGDLKDDELEDMLRKLREELERRKGRDE